MILWFTKRISLFILLGFFICAILLFPVFVGAGFKPVPLVTGEPPRAMWVWDVKIFQDNEATQRLLDFCKEKNIGTLFYTAYKVTGAVEKDYRNFNKLAHKNGIFVHALAGDPRWALEKYHDRFLEWISDVLEFNKRASSEERFDAVHTDIEPYLLGKAWELDSKNILIQHIDMYKKGKDLIAKNGSSILLAADMPFWYDDDPEMWIQWREKISPANYHILDIIDQIIVMDYRNFADGENGSILLVKNEISYADRVGKKVYIGQETTKDLTPEYITFANKSPDYMEAQIKKLVDVYRSHPSFVGIAIHHYISYKKFLRGNGN